MLFILLTYIFVSGLLATYYMKVMPELGAFRALIVALFFPLEVAHFLINIPLAIFGIKAIFTFAVMTDKNEGDRE